MMIIASSRNIPGDAAKALLMGKNVIRCENLRPCGPQSSSFRSCFFMVVAEQFSAVPCFLCFVYPVCSISDGVNTARCSRTSTRELYHWPRRDSRRSSPARCGIRAGDPCPGKYATCLRIVGYPSLALLMVDERPGQVEHDPVDPPVRSQPDELEDLPEKEVGMGC